MKSEAEPITDDEFVLRLIWHEFLTPGPPATVSDRAFTPKPNELGGVSLFRAACLSDVRETLLVIAPDKRSRYAIAALSVADLRALGLTVSPDPIATVAGHTTLTELTSVSWKADKAKWIPVLRSLAQLAAANIVVWPNQ